MKVIENIKNNKALNIVFNILYYALFILVLFILIVVALQRFSNNTISLGGFRIFNIVSESMTPKYEIGDVLLAKEVDTSNIKVGDDVVYNGSEGSFDGKIITHQVIKIDGDKFVTKGLANDIEDPEIDKSQICGVVIYKIQSLSAITKIVNNLYSFYFLIFVPIVVLIFVEIRKTILSKDE